MREKDEFSASISVSISWKIFGDISSSSGDSHKTPPPHKTLKSFFSFFLPDFFLSGFFLPNNDSSTSVACLRSSYELIVMGISFIIGMVIGWLLSFLSICVVGKGASIARMLL